MSAKAATNAARLAGKVAIVTGGASGYGAGIASLFATHGANVLVADIDEHAGRRTVASISSSTQNGTTGNSSGKVRFCKADVRREADWKEIVEVARGGFDGGSGSGRVDCLVNCAGGTYRNKPTLEVTEADFDKCFDLNVKSVFFGTAAIVRQFLEQKSGGSIINIASVGATRPRPGLVWYNSSKGAVWNATKGLAAEFGPHGIRVNSVCPLLGGTGLFESFTGVPNTPENQAKFLSNVPLGRLCEASDVASACLFFASDESAFVTGVNMEVDGGRAV